MGGGGAERGEEQPHPHRSLYTIMVGSTAFAQSIQDLEPTPSVPPFFAALTSPCHSLLFFHPLVAFSPPTPPPLLLLSPSSFPSSSPSSFLRSFSFLSRMSDAQLLKLKEDREALAREVALLNAAIKPEEASEKIVTHLRKAEDPFCLPSENDWNTASDQGACACVIA